MTLITGVVLGEYRPDREEVEGLDMKAMSAQSVRLDFLIRSLLFLSSSHPVEMDNVGEVLRRKRAPPAGTMPGCASLHASWSLSITPRPGKLHRRASQQMVSAGLQDPQDEQR